MAQLDNAAAADRIAPAEGKYGKFDFTTSASTYQAIRTRTSNEVLPAVYISFKVTQDCQLIFGGTGMGTIDANCPLFQSGDGWQDFELTSEMQGFRIKGVSASGSIYWFISGR
jgi:hypothetical protein